MTDDRIHEGDSDQRESATLFTELADAAQDAETKADAEPKMTDPHSTAEPGATVDGAVARALVDSPLGERPASASIEVPALGTVLVTGGGGFIGSHLVRALAACNDVRVLDTFDTGSRSQLPDDVTAIEGDVRDRSLLTEAATDVDVIVHLAAQVSVEDSLSDAPASNETNVAATLDVLELARREGARVVLASSAAIYGDPASVPVHETDPKRPESPYGVDKLAADNYARVYGARFDVPVTALRFFNAYGPGANAGVVKAFTERVLAGDPLLIHGDGEQTRDFVHVDDVVRATLAAATTPHTGRAYNVGTGERISILELAERLIEEANCSVPIEHAPPRSGDLEHSLASIQRARDQLGYEPEVDFDQGLESVLAVAPERSPDAE